MGAARSPGSRPPAAVERRCASGAGGRVLLLLTLAACARSPDAADQQALRRLCALPDDAVVTAWTGFPASAGFGQREGLELAGTFRPPADWSATAAGYRTAPWPEAQAAAERAFRLGAVFDGASAMRCETAGDDVLHATHPRPCTDVAMPIDLIACAVQPDGQVRAVVRSSY